MPHAKAFGKYHYYIYTVQLSIPIPQPWYPPVFFLPSYVPISALLPGLHYVNLIPENPEDTPVHTHPTPPSQLEHISTGTALPPVPTFLVKKIKSGTFVEMGDLIPTHLGLDDTACLKLRSSVSNISKLVSGIRSLHVSNCQKSNLTMFLTLSDTRF